ncbi:ABC transporter permease [Streptococcus hongkongensis]|nr:ABC transporter permease [Streptococcus uberis]
MHWSTIWELVKINLLYSSPQTMAAIKKKQEKNPQKHFVAYKETLKQQSVMVLVFLFIYAFMFIGIDFNKYPGYFSFYIALFFIMATLSSFTALYTIFYESNDLKLYVHMPIKSSEIYMAKVISSLGLGSMFLMPLLSLFIIAYWQILGNFWAIPIALFIFVILLISSIVFSLYINSWVGKVILRSSRRKLISTILMSLSAIGSIGLIFFLNFTNNTRMQVSELIDRSQIPFFSGYYYIIASPFSSQAVLNFWLPLLLILAMIMGVVKSIMPKYFQETLYSIPKTKANPQKKVTNRNFSGESLKQVMIRHHLSTIQNASLIIQTYLMPFIFIVSMLVPLLKSGVNLGQFLSSSYFGLAFLTGIILAVMGTSQTTFLGVAISLEKENFIFIKALPFNMKQFLMQKFMVLYVLQVSLPIVFYIIFSSLVLKVNLLMTLMFVLGYSVQAFIQGQVMYRRDYRYLSLRWQDISQLFTRGNSQWQMMGIMFGGMILGSGLIALVVILSLISKQALLINVILFIAIMISLAICQYVLKIKFWDKLDIIKE